MLTDGSRPVEISVAEDGDEGLTLAREGDYDVMVVDHQLPGLEGPEMLETLREEGLDVPTLAVTGTLEPEVAQRFVDAGAYDVWSKDEESPLRLRVTVDRLARLNRVQAVP